MDAQTERPYRTQWGTETQRGTGAVGDRDAVGRVSWGTETQWGAGAVGDRDAVGTDTLRLDTSRASLQRVTRFAVQRWTPSEWGGGVTII